MISAADAESFVDARPRLLRIARRVLLNPADADDIVQDAMVRWLQTDREVVRDPVAFLTTITTRLALNHGQSARARREAQLGAWSTELVDDSEDPALRTEQRDRLALALWIVLERLSSTERAVYVLREAFDYPHRRIAELLALSEANVRQIGARARRRLATETRRPVDPAAHRRLCAAFLAAAERGAVARLEAELCLGQRPRQLAA